MSTTTTMLEQAGFEEGMQDHQWYRTLPNDTYAFIEWQGGGEPDAAMGEWYYDLRLYADEEPVAAHCDIDLPTALSLAKRAESHRRTGDVMEAAGYAVVGTGGGCEAWERTTPGNGWTIFITNGDAGAGWGDDPDEPIWYAAVYRDDEDFSAGYAIHQADAITLDEALAIGRWALGVAEIPTARSILLQHGERVRVVDAHGKGVVVSLTGDPDPGHLRVLPTSGAYLEGTRWSPDDARTVHQQIEGTAYLVEGR